MDGWKTILSFWEFVTFQGRTVKLQVDRQKKQQLEEWDILLWDEVHLINHLPDKTQISLKCLGSSMSLNQRRSQFHELPGEKYSWNVVRHIDTPIKPASQNKDVRWVFMKPDLPHSKDPRPAWWWWDIHQTKMLQKSHPGNSPIGEAYYLDLLIIWISPTWADFLLNKRCLKLGLFWGAQCKLLGCPVGS